MNPWQAKVLEFHRAMKAHAPDRPTLENYPSELRVKLIREEAEEFADAVEGSAIDWPEAIDAIGDLLYVTIGAACAMGVDIDRYFEAIHVSNMAKFGGEKDASGKIMKPRGWTAPDIGGLLAEDLVAAYGSHERTDE